MTASPAAPGARTPDAPDPRYLRELLFLRLVAVAAAVVFSLLATVLVRAVSDSGREPA